MLFRLGSRSGGRRRAGFVAAPSAQGGVRPQRRGDDAPHRARAAPRRPPHAGHARADIATGTGLAAEAAAEAVGPSGHVAAADISPAMLDRARERLGALPNVTLAEIHESTQKPPLPIATSAPPMRRPNVPGIDARGGRATISGSPRLCGPRGR